MVRFSDWHNRCSQPNYANHFKETLINFSKNVIARNPRRGDEAIPSN
jgi:hypothetical protein